MESPELAKLQGKAKALRARIRRLEADYGDELIPARVWREQTDRQTVKLDRVNRRVAELVRSSRVAPILSAADPVAAFDALDVGGRQAVVDALLVVTLEKARPGVRVFDPATCGSVPLERICFFGGPVPIRWDGAPSLPDCRLMLSHTLGMVVRYQYG